jgi:hypothetical protein
MGNQTASFIPIIAVLLAALFALIGYWWKNRFMRPIAHVQRTFDDAKFVIVKLTIENREKSNSITLNEICVAPKSQIRIRQLPQSAGMLPGGVGTLASSNFSDSVENMNFLIAAATSASVNLMAWRSVARYQADQKISLHFLSSRLNWRRKEKTSTVKITLIAAE